MNDISAKAYSVLFIADYKNASQLWREFEDTIINNLLDKPAATDGGWTKFKNLPPMLTSIVEKAETREQAYDCLKKSRYDVVFVDNYLNGEPIGGGALKRFRKYHPDAIFIPLLDRSQKKGSKKRDGSISSGEGIRLIYNAGFYNGLYKNEVNLATIIKMIKAGGRPKEQAFAYYGLEAEAEYLPQEAGGIPLQPGQDKKEQDTMHEYGNGSGKKPGHMDNQRMEMGQENRPVQWETGHPREMEHGTWNERERPAGNKDSWEVQDRQKQEEYIGMKQNMMIQRGEMNSSLVVPGTLYGHVVFAKGNMVWVELDTELEHEGINFSNIYNVPVVIPFTRFESL